MTKETAAEIAKRKREERLAERLRENLRRRKAQARARPAPAEGARDEPPAPQGEDDAG
ncbi:hypothetical protein [Aureimonas populi]|uniref:DUF4169 domain-containing protein n=1 Tax=Aureimonas populi TaxID=1701758 RepID=A0ABW5CIG7_9HYPH|nr:hypothetical protein [Aureimonas populi]